MKRFVEGLDRGQSTLFPASLDDYVTEDDPVRAVDVFVDSLELDKLGLVGVQPLGTGRPSYHPRTMLNIRRLLTEGAVRASDKRAQFVGIDAYQAAGGDVMRDLFQQDDGGWLQDGYSTQG
jgi:hypothetical protein